MITSIFKRLKNKVKNSFKRNAWLKTLWRIKSFWHNRAGSLKRLRVPCDLQPFPHTYRDYHGPWIENYFYEYWCKHENKFVSDEKIERIYIPIFWTDYYVKNGLLKPHQAIQNYLDKTLQRDKKYFTIVQNDDGVLEKLPKNVLVFSSASSRDVPIPVLKGEPKSIHVERDLRCSFIGVLDGPNNRTGLRKKMYEALRCQNNINFFPSGSMKTFIEIISRSIFTLCPRGYGTTSFRLYEAIALGSIPIYIWDDIEWLPYKDRLDWKEFAISINVRDIETLPAIIDGHTEAMITKKQKKIQELHNSYFTMQGTCEQIVQMLHKTSKV